MISLVVGLATAAGGGGGGFRHRKPVVVAVSEDLDVPTHRRVQVSTCEKG